MDVPGNFISLLGSRKSEATASACSPWGVTARRFVGRWLRGSALVGIEEGPGSDMVGVLRCEGVCIR